MLTDGTLEGTVSVAATKSPFVLLNDIAYFAGTRGDLWRSDGTEAGTQLAIPVPRGIQSLAVVGDTLVYADAQSRLWSSDGTPKGTTLLRQFEQAAYLPSRDWLQRYNNPNSDAARGYVPLEELIQVGDQVFFTAKDDTHGTELWSTDGTEEGTQLAADIAPGPKSSTPTSLTASGDRLVFVANDGLHGDELWTVDTSRSENASAGDTDGDNDIDFADFLILSANFGTETVAGPGGGDFDDDGKVTFADFLILSANYRAKST